jgi:hypothetical protein
MGTSSKEDGRLWRGSIVAERGGGVKRGKRSEISNQLFMVCSATPYFGISAFISRITPERR